MADSLASQIITAIGGPENVRSLTHCATRLRFELADASKVDQNALEHMKGVLGAVPQSGDRFQVVIGGGVATVYENIMHLPEMANAGAASASGEGQKSNADVKAEARSKARGKVHGRTPSSSISPTPSARSWACCSAPPSSSPWSTCSSH